MPENDVTLRLAEEIIRYLENRPDAADTVEGISRWWLMKQRFQNSIAQVEKALEYLEHQNLIKKDTLTGQVICRGTAQLHAGYKNAQKTSSE